MKKKDVTPVFFDTEFTGLHQNTTLISIGLVANTGEKFYAELTDYSPTQVDDWIQKNVIENLLYNDIVLVEKSNPFKSKDFLVINEDPKDYRMKTDTKHLAEHLQRWFMQFDTVEMWADVLTYDWILFCNIFGGAMKIPSNVYYAPFDIATLLKARGFDPDTSRDEFARIPDEPNLKKHNALYDAMVAKGCYMILMNGLIFLAKFLHEKLIKE